MSCDILASTRPFRRAGVSIARRRLVVLRLPLLTGEILVRLVSFNRPKAISCLATKARGSPSPAPTAVSIARRRLVVLRRDPHGHLGLSGRGVSIARRRLVVLRPMFKAPGARVRPLVSIARRRLVVLRREGVAFNTLLAAASFNRPKAISCLATCSHRGADMVDD